MGEFPAQRLRSLLKSDPLSLFLVLTLCTNAADGSASEYPQLAHPGDDTAEILETGNVTVGLGVCLISFQTLRNKLPLVAASPEIGLPHFFMSLPSISLIFLWIFIIQLVMQPRQVLRDQQAGGG